MVPNKMLASDTARPNLLQNGGLEVWTRGPGPFSSTGQASTISLTYGPDRWEVSGIGNDTVAVSQDTINKDSGVSCAACTFTLGASSAGSSTFNQAFAAADGMPLSGQTLTFSVRVKTSTANAVRPALYNGTTWTYGAYHSGNGQYQTLSVTAVMGAIPASPDWQVVGAVNFVGTSCVAYVDSATLSKGVVPANYVPAINYPDALPNGRVAPDVPRVNLLTNGGFEVFQRGRYNTNAATFLVDRWWCDFDGSYAGVGFGNNTNPANGLVGGSQICVYMTGQGPTVGARMRTWQRLENRAQLAGRTLTFACDVWADKPNEARIDISDNVGGNTFSPYHPGDAQWHRLSVTATISPSMTDLVVELDYYTTGLGGYFYAYYDNATLVDGTVAADYHPLTAQEDLARCLRYYQRWNCGSNVYLLHGIGQSATAYYFMLPFQGPLAGTPTYTTSAVSYWSVSNETLSSAVACSGLSLNSSSQNAAMVYAQTASAIGTAGTPKGLYSNNPSGWMAVEYNP